MEIEILRKKENQLLERTEIEFKVKHSKEKTPKRLDVRDVLANLLKESKDTIIIHSMIPEFGKSETTGYAKVYKSKDKALKIERDPRLIRVGLKPKKEKAKKEKKPKEAAAGKEPAKAQEPAKAKEPAKDTKETPPKDAKAKEPKEGAKK